MKRAWIAFAATLALVLPIRILSMLRYLNPQTGFYSDGGRMAGVASILLVAGACVAVFFAMRSAEAELGTEPFKNLPAAVLGALAGIFVLVQSVVGIATGFLGEGQIFYHVFCYSGILAGAVLLMTAYDFAAGMRTVGSRPLLALIPSLWGCFFLVVLFITYSAIVNLVEDVYHTFTVVFLLLFLFVQAKLLTGIESSKTGKMIYAVGLPASLLALATGVPSCVQYFSAGETAGFVSVGLHMANIMLALYIVAFLSSLPHALRPVAAEPSAPVSRSDGPEPSESDPKRGENSIAVYVGFLKTACSSGEKFVGVCSSPFAIPEKSMAEENS